METKRIYVDPENKTSLCDGNSLEDAVREGAELLCQGEVVAFPTETVYGLGADALNERACARIFAIKGRPADNPLIVHVTSIREAKKIVKEWPDEAEICAREFWPGPLTLVLPKNKIVPDIVSGNLQTVAVRMPSHPVALALIAMAGCPVAAPSANISGKPSPTEGKHVWQDFQDKIPLLIDAGKCIVGLESTVLDLSGEIPIILRPGGVTLEQLAKVLGRVEIDKGAKGKSEVLSQPRSPGMKYRHYAPKGEIQLISGQSQEKVEELGRRLEGEKSNKRVALICLEETVASLTAEALGKIDLLFTLGTREKPREAASRLFEALRICDEEDIEIILAEDMPEEGIGLAFMNRLKKAVGKGNLKKTEKI
jgi:L-threonylcarbamoyladenylate synthase